jgi:hypothetical protein
MGLINELVEVFPTRPLKVMKLKQESSSNQIENILVIIFYFGLAMFIALNNYPGLLTDYKISRNPVVVDYDVEIKCRVKLINHCSVKITTDTGQVITRDYLFLPAVKENCKPITVASADDPSLVTIALAINYMRARFEIITFITLLLLLIVPLSLSSFLKIHKMIKVIDEIDGQKLTPVIVPIKLTPIGKYILASYSANNAQGVNIKFAASFNKNLDGGPIIIGDETEDQCNALAVIGESNPVPILLDQNFTRCDFTDNEIQALKKALS